MPLVLKTSETSSSTSGQLVGCAGVGSLLPCFVGLRWIGQLVGWHPSAGLRTTPSCSGSCVEVEEPWLWLGLFEQAIGVRTE